MFEQRSPARRRTPRARSRKLQARASPGRSSETHPPCTLTRNLTGRHRGHHRGAFSAASWGIPAVQHRSTPLGNAPRSLAQPEPVRYGQRMKRDRCRHCQTDLTDSVVDLGMSPLCESYLPADRLDNMEPFYPLHVSVCRKCLLVQLNEYVTADHIFTEYAYFSSFSTAWLKHAEDYVEMISHRLELGPKSFVVELASNDGYLLQYFVKKS